MKVSGPQHFPVWLLFGLQKPSIWRGSLFVATREIGIRECTLGLLEGNYSGFLYEYMKRCHWLGKQELEGEDQIKNGLNLSSLNKI